MTATPEEILAAMRARIASEDWYESDDSYREIGDALAERVLLAALRAACEQGWRLVPVQATEEMCRAELSPEQVRWGFHPEKILTPQECALVWSAMLATTPDLLEEKL